MNEHLLKYLRRQTISRIIQSSNMKRNMDIIRDILLSIEELPPGGPQHTLQIKGEWKADEVVGHLRLVRDAGLVDGQIEFYDKDVIIAIFGLSNEGHDLLDTIRDEQVWNKTKTEVGKVGGTVAIETLKAVAIAVTAKILGI